MTQLPKLKTLIPIGLFFVVVAYFLGPNIIEHRTNGAAWYVLHIGGGTLVLLLGPFQFVPEIRNRLRRYHRMAGYTFIVGSVMAIIGYIGMPKTELTLVSQLVALVFWALSISLAVRAIRARRVLAHQHNMARSFVLACYFLTGRLLDRFGMGLLAPLAESESLRIAHSDWLAWLVPLAIVEAYFASKWQSRTKGAKEQPDVA